MVYIAPILNTQVLLLSSPLVVGIAIFAYLLWSDRQYDQARKTKSNNKQIITSQQ